MHLSAATLLLVTLATCGPRSAPPPESECLTLQGGNALGIPAHPAPGDGRISERLLTGSEVRKLGRDEASKWVHIQSADGVQGWLTERYLGPPHACEAFEQAKAKAQQSDERARAPIASQPADRTPWAEAVIGGWNLEWLSDAHDRGYPESMSGGATYPPRTDDDYKAIAAIITRLKFAVLALSEIDGYQNPAGVMPAYASHELDRLTGHLGPSWQYERAASGSRQHVALLYDTRRVRLERVCEASLPTTRVDGKSLADRQPLLGHFTLLSEGAPHNDLAVVAVHLAAGMDKARNHDAAMSALFAQLDAWRAKGDCLPKDEQDVIVVGDFNASPFDGAKETLWFTPGWKSLSGDIEVSWPQTRLSGVPLRFVHSRLDHILVTDGTGALTGLWGEEIKSPLGRVHQEVVTDPDAYRASISDHVPVSVVVEIGPDTD